MADSVRLSVRVPADLAKRVERVAGGLERSRSYVAVKALERFCEDEEEIQEAIRRGVAEADAGKTVPHEDVVRMFERLKAKHRRSRKR